MMHCLRRLGGAGLVPVLLGAAMAVSRAGDATAQDRVVHDCIIEPAMVVEVGSAVEGIITQIDAERGKQIRKGDVIARLDATVERETLRIAEALAQSQVDIDIAKARVTLLEKTVERARTLLRRNAGTQVDLDVAEAELVTAKLEVARAEENHMMNQMERDRAAATYERRVVRSPIDGVLLRRLIGPGEFIHSQAQVAQIANVDPLYVDVFLPTALYNDVAVGQLAIVRPAAPIGGTYEAEIKSIDQVFDAASDTFGVRLELPNPGQALPGGVDCSLTLTGSG